MQRWTGLLPLLAAVGCGAGTDAGNEAASEASATVAPSDLVSRTPRIDDRRSLAVTDRAILDGRFAMRRVIDTILASAGSGADAASAYQQWWDTQNDAASAFVPGAPHCDDRVDADGNPILNGFPLQCPRNEGQLADLSTHDPFCEGPGCDPYLPIGLFNRFDLAPADGAHCGEYRIIYGKDGAAGGRNLVIFEAVLPNPNPECGLAACRPVAQFWADLSRVDDPARRADALERFYFEGLPGFEPVVHWSHYSPTGGQIRSNQFMNGPNTQIWQLREFKLDRTCDASARCRLRASQVTVKTNPFGQLFDPNASSRRAQMFQDPASSLSFIDQVEALSVNDVNGFSMSTSGLFDAGQSTSQPSPDPALKDTDYPFWFGRPGPTDFRDAIQAKLDELGSDLTPLNIVRRAQAMSCGGCHQLSNGADLGGGVTWPPSLGFVHVSEQITEPCDSGACFAISPALRNVFLPARRDNLATYLGSTPCGADACVPPGPTTPLSTNALGLPLRVH